MSRISMTGVKKFVNKRVLTLAGVCLLLVGAIVANVVLSRSSKNEEEAASAAAEGDGAVSVSSTQQDGFFDLYRAERDTVRTQEIAYLDAIVAQGADEETLSDAQKQKLALISYMELELTCENLIKAKGFSDVIVSMHAGSVNVVVGSQELKNEEVAQILDIVLRETGQTAENVNVSTSVN